MSVRFRNWSVTLILSFFFLNTYLMAEDNHDDKIAATVNGEAIHESEISFANGPADVLGIVADKARQIRLERMIRARIIGQYLKIKKIEVSETEVDAEIEALRKNPPSAGCSCCRYPTFEAFMEANYFDMKELRGELSNSLATDKYLNALWEKEYPEAKQEDLIRMERPRLEKEYVKVSHIFFNTFQNPELENSPDKVRKETKAKAIAAWKRLQKGESFEAVVKAVSEDTFSRQDGGSLGYVKIDYFGDSFAKAASKLKTGEYSEPVESTLGFHIIRKEILTKKNILSILKDDYRSRIWLETEKTILNDAKVERKQ